MGMKTTKSTRFPKLGQKHKQSQFQIQIMKPKKQKQKTRHMKDKNPKRFYCKNEIRTKQSYDKITYPKLMLNILKVIKGPTYIYTP